MEFFKKTAAFSLSLLIFLTSCNGDYLDNNTLNSNTGFDLTFFNNNKGNLINLKKFKVKNEKTLSSRLEVNNLILEEINDQLGTDLDFSIEFKELELTDYDSFSKWVFDNNIMTSNEMNLVSKFYYDLNSLELYDAILNLENNVYKENLDPFMIEKFEYIANVVSLIEYEDPGFFKATNETRSCAGALLGLAFASAGLVAACNPPAAGATVGFGCYLAAANFIRASATVGIECGDQDQQ